MATTTDVRAWLREQGETVPDRGRLPRGSHARYEAAHTTSPEPEPDAPAGPDYDAGVTEADFPPEPQPTQTATAERKPRKVKAKSGPGGLRERIWGAGKAKPRRKGPRVSLQPFIEGLWGDLAWLSAGLPPVQKILYAQAPYAGVLVEDTAKGTVVDTVLQWPARQMGAVRVLNGLVGPPLFTAMICTAGVRDPETGEPDPRTKAMFLGLKYSLMDMVRASGAKLEEISARAEEVAAQGAAVDQFMAWLFEIPQGGAVAEEEAIKRAQAMTGAGSNGSA